jgi:Zn-dependent oligopeptidase
MAWSRCWEPKVLEKMSSHYKTQEPLSPELIDKLIRRCVSNLKFSRIKHDAYHSRYVNVGLFYLRQLFFAKFDLKVHVDKGWMHALL